VEAAGYFWFYPGEALVWEEFSEMMGGDTLVDHIGNVKRKERIIKLEGGDWS